MGRNPVERRTIIAVRSGPGSQATAAGNTLIVAGSTLIVAGSTPIDSGNTLIDPRGLLANSGYFGRGRK